MLNEHALEIRKIANIMRVEQFPYLCENTGFSHKWITSLIIEGKSKTEPGLQKEGF